MKSMLYTLLIINLGMITVWGLIYFGDYLAKQTCQIEKQAIVAEKNVTIKELSTKLLNKKLDELQSEGWELSYGFSSLGLEYRLRIHKKDKKGIMIGEGSARTNGLRYLMELRYVLDEKPYQQSIIV